MQEKYSKEVEASVGSDESKKIMEMQWPDDTLGIYFLDLRLTDASGKLVSSNFYWLSGKGDKRADFTGLKNLPEVTLNVPSTTSLKTGEKYSLEVTIENPSSSLAFFINPKIVKSFSQDLVLSVFWDDNYFSLLPGEKRTVKVEFNTRDLGGEKATLKVEGWNTKPWGKEL
jgi:hypothetical protein